jgi:hypothetical protein
MLPLGMLFSKYRLGSAGVHSEEQFTLKTTVKHCDNLLKEIFRSPFYGVRHLFNLYLLCDSNDKFTGIFGQVHERLLGGS